MILHFSIVFINFTQIFLYFLCVFVALCLYLSVLHIYILQSGGKYFPTFHENSSSMSHTGTNFDSLLAECFLIYTKTISCNKKRPERGSSIIEKADIFHTCFFHYTQSSERTLIFRPSPEYFLYSNISTVTLLVIN